MYLDPIVPGVEEADAPDVGQDGVFGVVQHVVSGHWGEAVSLYTNGTAFVCVMEFSITRFPYQMRYYSHIS